MSPAARPPTRGDLVGKGRVASLGMLIIDQFQTTGPDGTSHISEEESIGGGGVYAMACARMFLPPSHCGMIIDAGHDFPPRFRAEIEMFGEEMTWFRPRDSLTTRALNIYSGSSTGEGHQSFRYLAPQLRLHLRDLLLPPSPLAHPEPEWVHIVCSTARAREIIRESQTLEVGVDRHSWSGHLVWEPLPLSCVPAELPSFIELSPHLAVISPNLLELQSLLSIEPGLIPPEEEAVSAAERFHSALDTRECAIVVRAGRLGSYTLAKGWSGWVRPYFAPDEQDQVVDPTGGGNGFLGGLCAGLLLSNGDFRLASMFAATAASFAIEQKGLPRLTVTDEGRELWNGTDPWSRLHELLERHDVSTM